MQCPCQATRQRLRGGQGLPGAGREGLGRNSSSNGFLLGDENVMELDVKKAAQSRECIKNNSMYDTQHFKWANCMLCEFSQYIC